MPKRWGIMGVHSLQHSKQFEDVQKEIRDKERRRGAGGGTSESDQQKPVLVPMVPDAETVTSSEKALEALVPELSAVQRKAIVKDGFTAEENQYADSGRRALNDRSKDLLQALRRKAEDDRRKGVKIADMHESPWTVFLQEGRCCLSRGSLNAALRSFTKAISIDEENASEAFVGRANCYLKMGKPQKALEDTDKADKHYRKGMSRIDGLQTSKFLTEEDRDINISQERKRLLKLKVGLMRSRAEALYELSSFERSLIYFHRCEKARPDMAVEFRKGLKKAKNAIVNALAPDCFSLCPDLEAVIRDIYKMDATVKKAQAVPIVKKVRRVQFAGWLQASTSASSSDDDGADCKMTTSATSSLRRRKKKQTKGRKRKRRLPVSKWGGVIGGEDRRTRVDEEDVAALGKLSEDYGFLKELIVKHEKTTGGGYKNLVAREALSFLEERKEFWKQQDPRNCLDTRRAGVR